MIKPYSVEVEVTTRWTVEIHADNEDEAKEKAEELAFSEIEISGDFEETLSAEVTNIEEIINDD
jgi:hypothetical protein